MQLKSPVLLAAVLAVALNTPLTPFAGEGANAQSSNQGDPLRPKRHFKLERPALLSANEAMTIYDNISEDMFRGYAISKSIPALNFPKWRKFNRAPYKSKTHGNRYLNNYANPLAAKTYGDFKENGKMPVGAILAKDSFTVTREGAVYAGALSIMEKMPVGADPKNGDWRYVMIMPDGSYFGDSTGESADKVGFCHGCHVAVEKTDFLFFVPDAFKVRSLK